MPITQKEQTDDVAFTDGCKQKFELFKSSPESEFHFEPMNSYQRRLVHQLAIELEVGSYSEGERDKRHIVITKDIKEAKENAKSITPFPKLKVSWDFGEKEFMLANKKGGLEVYLDKNGFVGVVDHNFDEKTEVIDRKLVTSGKIKIKSNKIIEFTDSDY